MKYRGLVSSTVYFTCYCYRSQYRIDEINVDQWPSTAQFLTQPHIYSDAYIVHRLTYIPTDARSYAGIMYQLMCIPTSMWHQNNPHKMFVVSYHEQLVNIVSSIFGYLFTLYYTCWILIKLFLTHTVTLDIYAKNRWFAEY